MEENLSIIDLEKIIISHLNDFDLHVRYFNNQMESSIRKINIIDYRYEFNFLVAYCFHSKGIRFLKLDSIENSFVCFGQKELFDLSVVDEYFLKSKITYKKRRLLISQQQGHLLKLRYIILPSKWRTFHEVLILSVNSELNEIYVDDLRGTITLLTIDKIISIEVIAPYQ